MSLTYRFVDPSTVLQAPDGEVAADTFFVSEWSTGTGSTTAVIEDTDRTRSWNMINNQWEVRTTATDGRDFPTTNYIRLNAGPSTIALSAAGYNSAPEIGDSVYLRYYYRYQLTGSHSPGDGTEHGNYFDDDPIGGVNWGPAAFGIALESSVTPSSVFELSIWGNDGNPFYGPDTLDKETTYRFEWRFTRTGSATYTIAFRIYNISGTLLYDENDFVQRDAPNDTMAAVVFTGANSTEWNSMTGFQIGINAQQGSTGTPFGEYAAVLMRTDDWPGPYQAAEVNWSPS